MTQPILVDSNVLIDVLKGDTPFTGWARTQLAQAVRQKEAVINPLILAELAAFYDSPEALDEAVSPSELRRVPLPFEAAFYAGQAFVAYRKRGGVRRSPLPDFYIGAHAHVEGLKLLTRDAKRYRTYFPSVELITPPGL